jgi:hypothetical protein
MALLTNVEMKSAQFGSRLAPPVPGSVEQYEQNQSPMSRPLVKSPNQPTVSVVGALSVTWVPVLLKTVCVGIWSVTGTPTWYTTGGGPYCEIA